MKLQNPRNKFLHELSVETTMVANIANEPTIVAKMVVPDSMVWLLKSGVVLNGHFKDGSDTFGGDGDKIALAYKKAGSLLWKAVEDAEQVMGGFNNTTKGEQLNKENDDGRRFMIRGGHIAFQPKDTIGIIVESAKVMSATYTHFKLTVTEMDKR